MNCFDRFSRQEQIGDQYNHPELSNMFPKDAKDRSRFSTQHANLQLITLAVVQLLIPSRQSTITTCHIQKINKHHLSVLVG